MLKNCGKVQQVEMTLFLLSFGRTCHNEELCNRNHGSVWWWQLALLFPHPSKWFVISGFRFICVHVVQRVNTILRKVCTESSAFVMVSGKLRTALTFSGRQIPPALVVCVTAVLGESIISHLCEVCCTLNSGTVCF